MMIIKIIILGVFLSRPLPAILSQKSPKHQISALESLESNNDIIFSFFLQHLTFGMVNIDNKNRITFKDPITGMLNLNKDMLNKKRSL
jgi:hypothetical protein